MKNILKRVRSLSRPGMGFGLLIAVLLLGGCGPAAVKPATLEQANAISARSAASEYRLQPGDELDIRFYYNPELNTSVLIRPDGRISLPLANEIQAAGL